MDDNNPLGSEQQPNPRAFDVGAQPQVPPPSSAPTSQPQPQTPPPAAVMAQQLQQADTQHHSMLGKAFRSLMGNDTSFQIDPQTGKAVQTDTPRQPGQFFKSVIAASILGGATAARNRAPGFVQGAAEGGGAAIEHGEQEEDKKRQQAQEQFKNQLTSRSANTEEDLKRAQIAMHNAQTLRENQIMQREDYSFHKEVAENGMKQIKPYIDADPSLVKFKDVSESDMHDLMKNNPNAHNALWEPTGTRIVIGADGKPNVEATYTGVDPTGKVKVTDSQIQHWEAAGLKQIYGKEWGVLKDGKELDVKQYMALNQKAQELNNQQLSDKKIKLDEDKEEAAIALTKAQASHFKAESAKLYSDEADRKAASEAFDILSSGKDVSKLSIKGREALSKGLTEIIKTNMNSIKDLPKNALGQLDEKEQVKAGELYETAEKYQKILDRVYGIKSPEAAKGGTASGDKVRAERNGKVLYIPKDQVDAFQKENPDAKVGQDVTVPPDEERSDLLDKMISGEVVKPGDSGPPSLDTVPESKALFTDGKGRYIVRPKDFKNPQWKHTGDGTLSERVSGDFS